MAASLPEQSPSHQEKSSLSYYTPARLDKTLSQKGCQLILQPPAHSKAPPLSPIRSRFCAKNRGEGGTAYFVSAFMYK